MTVPGMCQVCRHWHTDGERYRSWKGECLNVASATYERQMEADESCARWQSMMTRREPAQPGVEHPSRRRWYR
jgi:hypothetical protein